MRFTQENAVLVKKTEIAPGVFDLLIKAPAVAQLASIGQFVHISCADYPLRRPISLAGIMPQVGLLRLIMEIRGKGTAWLAARQEGETLDIMGPLGHGFPIEEDAKSVILVGGGIGLPPLLPLATHYREKALVISGFRTASAAILQDDVAACGARAQLCTDDGSAGMHGFTTQALQQALESAPCDVIYTCGPKVMMRGVAALAAKHGVLCYVSMEERMGCGVGACLGCTCHTKDADGADHHTRVCLNGPVFDAREVVWE